MTTLETLPEDILQLLLANGGFHPSLGSVNKRFRNLSTSTRGSIIATDRKILCHILELHYSYKCCNGSIAAVMENLDAIKNDNDALTAETYMGVFCRAAGMDTKRIRFVHFTQLANRFFSYKRMEVLKTNVAPYAAELRITNFLGWIQLQWKYKQRYEPIGWPESINVKLEINNDVFQPPNEYKLYNLKDYVLK